MSLYARLACSLFLVIIAIFPYSTFADSSLNIPILCYHNFSPTTPGSMNLRPDKFEAQITWLKNNGFTIIPLNEAVEYLQGKRDSLPEKSVVITMDDGWQSVYKYIVPLAKKHNIPITLFIYPETISKGKNAMTWDELKEMEKTGLFYVQGHTYSHPNFKQEKRRLSAENFAKSVQRELVNSKHILEKNMGHPITLLAWPFGIYNDYLERAAKDAGYTMAFTIDARTANRNYRSMAQPRFMIVDGLSTKTFVTIANGAKKVSK